MWRAALGLASVSMMLTSFTSVPAQSTQKSERSLPGVDQSAPAKIETATLALG